VTEVETVLRELAPHVLAVLVKRYGQFDQCEDAVQEALLAASLQWPGDGVPANPTGWLVTVAGRRWTEQWRSDQARRRREAAFSREETPEVSGDDDELTLFLLCCHPALSVASQVALTLRAVGGLTTAEIARALLVPESTVGQRISRAKQQIRNAGTRFEPPPPDQLPARVAAVRQVLYLIFNEGYTASSGPALHRVQLTAEAIRLTRQLHARRPGDGETAGLLALMLLTDARRAARTGPDGALVPLEEQDRTRWDAEAIAEGTALIEDALGTTEVGPFQLQAAIAAVHDEATSAAGTDWPQILVLYDLLVTVAPVGALAARTDLIRTASTADDGSFEVKGVAPGEYAVFAWEGLDDYAVRSPEFLKLFASKAAAVTVPAGAPATVQVKSVRAEEMEEATWKGQQ